MFDLNNTTGIAKIGNYGGGGVGAAYATFDWGTTGNTTFSQFGTFFVKDILGNESFSVKISTNTVKISNAFTLPTGASPSNGLITLTSAGVSTWSLLNTASITAGAVTYAKIQNVTGSRLIGNPTGGSAAPSEIGLTGTLIFSGSTLGTAAFTGDVTTPTINSFVTTITANAVTYAKFQQVAASSLVGNPTGSLGNAQGITLGAGLAFSGTTLIATGSGGITALTGDVTASGTGSVTATIAANAVTYAKFQQVAASSLVGNPTGSLANAQGITLGTGLTFSGTTLNATQQALTSTQVAFGNGSNLVTSSSQFTYGATSFNVGYALNGTAVTLDDTAKTAVIKAAVGVSLRDAGGHHFIDVNPVAQKVIIGDISGTGSGNQFQLDFVTNINTSFSTGFLVRWSGVNYLNIDANAFLYQMGDIGGSNNHTYLEINDATQRIKLTNVPVYANDAAATGAGLVSGQLYQTTTLGTTSLNIVP